MTVYTGHLNGAANQSTIKQANKGLVFEVINTVGPCSRTQIAQITGLTKTSITNITAEMIEDHIICEVGSVESESSLGRKPVMLDISPHSPCTVGLSINRDCVFLGLVNLRGELQYETRLYWDAQETTDSFFSKVFSCCDKAIAFCADKVPLGIGVASIGPLNLREGTILSPPNFKGLHDIPIVTELRERYGLPVVLENDMSACAIMERLFGLGKKLNNFIYVGVTHGIGTGVVLNREHYLGTNGFAGEIGHISIDYNGKPCPCGNRGCLELYASIAAVEQQARIAVAQGASGALCEKQRITWPDIVQAAQGGDGLAADLLGQMVDYLATGCVMLANMYDPQVIFLGYDIAIAGDLIIEPLKAKVNRLIFAKDFIKVDIKISLFGDTGYKRGGAAALINQYLHGYAEV